MKPLFLKYLDLSYRFFISLKLAIFSLISLALISIVGTIVESVYDAYHAQMWVYKSFPLYFICGLLSANLMAVMVSRWPWKKRHTAFLMAHIGILTLLVGSFMTQVFGIDGVLLIPVKESARYVRLNDRKLDIYKTSKDLPFAKIFSSNYPFSYLYFNKKNFSIPLEGEDSLDINGYHPFVTVREEIGVSDKKVASQALKFQLKSQFFEKDFYIYRLFSRSKQILSLGPLDIVLAKKPQKPTKDIPTIILRFLDEKKVLVSLFKNKKLLKSKKMKAFDTFKTPWMNLEFKVLDLFFYAEKKMITEAETHSSDRTVSSLSFNFKGQKHNLPLNSILRLFVKDTPYIVAYSNSRIDVGFDVFLKEFRMKTYPGTSRASSYESLVTVDGKDHLISMNEPLKYKSYTFYQASFQRSDFGEPTASVLSVNKDPGRFLKYFGCFLLTFGSLLLFIKRRKKI